MRAVCLADVQGLYKDVMMNVPLMITAILLLSSCGVGSPGPTDPEKMPPEINAPVDKVAPVEPIEGANR